MSLVKAWIVKKFTIHGQSTHLANENNRFKAYNKFMKRKYVVFY